MTDTTNPELLIKQDELGLEDIVGSSLDEANTPKNSITDKLESVRSLFLTNTDIDDPDVFDQHFREVLASEDEHAMLDGQDRAFVAYLKLGITPEDSKDVEDNVFKSWFSDEATYGEWLGSRGGESNNLSLESDNENDSEQPSLTEQTLRARLTNAVIVTGAGVSLFVEQSPINEALRTNAGLEVLQETQSALAVGATVAAITVAIEAVPSTFISLGLHREGGAVQKLKAKLVKKEQEEAQPEKDEKPSTKSKVGKLADTGADVGIALGLGAGLVTVKKHIQDSDPTLAKDLKTSAKATGIVAGVSGLIGYLAGGGIQNAEKVGLETPAQYVIDYGTDTKFWMGVLGVGYGTYFAKKGIDKLRNNNSEIKVEE